VATRLRNRTEKISILVIGTLIWAIVVVELADACCAITNRPTLFAVAAKDGGLILVLIGRLLTDWAGLMLPAMRDPVGFGADSSSADMDLSLSSWTGTGGVLSDDMCHIERFG
jgi:hypothetical protein